MEDPSSLDEISITWEALVDVTRESNDLEVETPIPTRVWLVGFSHQGHDMEMMFVNFLN